VAKLRIDTKYTKQYNTYTLLNNRRLTMRILDNDPQGSNGGTLFEMSDGEQIRLLDILKMENPNEKYNVVIDNILTYEEAVRRHMRHHR